MSLDFTGENEFGFFILKDSTKNKYPILELQDTYAYSGDRTFSACTPRDMGTATFPGPLGTRGTCPLNKSYGPLSR